ncbi:MAG TPA: 5-formyltetrahydrofolate cyclo-ligase [Verrucomicrobiae bacterium]|jgi:5-formyltetrahydrofolate cyclo-ligase|nr:5-formyltetrahydrofolate cyclo-ligase [Verrucomicrobiae bacterium]
MSAEAISTKAGLRAQLRAILKSQSEAASKSASAQAVQRLPGQSVWKKATSVLFYSPIAGEIDLSPLIESALKSGKTVALPRYAAESGTYEVVQVTDVKRDCVPGKFGISEPGPHCEAWLLNALDLALVPGLGFDLAGRRLGRGKGFYDRLLSRIAGAKCGVALDQQILTEIPAENHDVRMDFILTPTRWWEVSG